MKSNGRKFQKNDAAFTGLEAAIVLIAFVVVAAVFSYVMLGAGFFTSQKSKEVVHTGVDQATSSIQTNGDITGLGNAGAVTNIYVTLSLTAGNNPVDTSKVTVSYKDPGYYNPSVTPLSWTWLASNEGTTPPLADDGMLDQFEKVRLNIPVPAGAAIATAATATNAQFTIEIKPASGAILPITLTTPPTIPATMVLG
ncbi:MAG TPA: archaellin/type IV pilin N-terminal domain-containing protein [Methanocella sp.]|nr:archaellin/type IV pilin N-terminal domain-containing protein [Methanocella sp.]